MDKGQIVFAVSFHVFARVCKSQSQTSNIFCFPEEAEHPKSTALCRQTFCMLPFLNWRFWTFRKERWPFADVIICRMKVPPVGY